MRARARHQLILRGPLPQLSRRHGDALDGPERPSGRTSPPNGDTPSTIMSPAPEGSWTEIRLGARAHHRHRRLPNAHAPPRVQTPQPVNPDAALAAGSLDRRAAFRTEVARTGVARQVSGGIGRCPDHRGPGAWKGESQDGLIRLRVDGPHRRALRRAVPGISAERPR